MIWIITTVGCIISFAIGWFLRQRLGEQKLARAGAVAKQMIEDAESEVENLHKEKLLEAKDEIFQMKQEQEREAKFRQGELQRREKQLSDRELNLDRKVDILNKKEDQLNRQERSLQSKSEYLSRKESELLSLVEEENRRLESISGLSTHEAKQIQLQNMLERAKEEAAAEIQQIREQAKQTSAREAREIVMQALESAPIDHVVETTVSAVKLPDDEMKGRIIGREGRNIRAFEGATGVEVLIDDTPSTVVLSAYDPLRREIARLALEKLIYDGRIHPGRIEEVVQKTRADIDEKILEVGEQVLHEVGIHGLHQELIRLLGKQNYRTTYGQNLLQHSKEVALLAGKMATLLGLDVRQSKRAGLLHEVGKTAEEYTDISSYEGGAELVKKYGENDLVQNAIAAMAPNSPVEPISPIAALIKVADAVSVSRPGAQKEVYDNYIKRMANLEEVACSFSGITRAYAIQAGKEMRVIAEHSLVKQAQAQVLADKISAKIKSDLNVPGQVRITVIREYRAVDYAK